MEQPQTNTPATAKPWTITRLFSFDVNGYLSIIMGSLAIGVLFASVFIFYFYLYIPALTPLPPARVEKPAVNEALLQKALEKSQEQRSVLEDPLENTPPNPFSFYEQP